MNTADLIWMNGEFVAWEDAKVHVLSHALHYGTSVFEGERAYELEDGGTAIFRHQDHLERLQNSARLYYMDLPFSPDELREVTHELIVRNGFKSCYIRPVVYRSYGPMGLDPLDNPVEAAIAVWEWAPYLGEEGKRNGVRAKVSSWRRISPQSLIPHSKAGGQYLNSVLAKIESKKAGYEEGILLDEHGNVCEGTGENIFVIKDGRISTPGQVERDPRRDHAQVDHRDRGGPRPSRSSSATSPGRSLTLADEIFLVGTAVRADARARDRRHRDRAARRDHPPDRAGLRRRPARPRRALREVARPRAGTIQGVNVLPRNRNGSPALPRAANSLGGGLPAVAPRSYPRLLAERRSSWLTRSSSTTPPSATACRAAACRCPWGRRCAWRTRSTGSAST